MTVIADCDLAADDLAIGRAVPEGARVELARVSERPEGAVGYFWVTGGPAERLRSRLAEQRVVERVGRLDGPERTDGGDSRRFHGRYRVDREALLAAAFDHDGTVLEATGDADQWSLLLQFPDENRFGRFRHSVTRDHAASLAVDRVYAPADDESPATVLTPRQRETLVTAYEEGYFDVPRRITLVDLAENLGVSDQAVSERLRRGEAELVRTQLLDGD